MGFADSDVAGSRSFVAFFFVACSGDMGLPGYTVAIVVVAIVSAAIRHRSFVRIHWMKLTTKQPIWFS